jgi:uncharacterized protein (TIGR02996 family)
MAEPADSELERAFTQALEAKPSDQATRMAFADFLMERGRHGEALLLVAPRWQGCDQVQDGLHIPGLLEFLYSYGRIHQARMPLREWRDHGRWLMQSHPLRNVRLTDRVAARTRRGKRVCWQADPSNDAIRPGTSTSSYLPFIIFGKLTGFVREEAVPNGPVRRWYPGHIEANAALSVTCLRWAMA